jgi:HPt (histidine-containing phosphotransfer) domain-containing protein
LDAGTLVELRASVGDDDEFFRELVDELLEDAPTQLGALRTAAGSDDADSARRAAHTLKGHGRTFGATKLASLCQDAEAKAAAGELDAVRGRIDEIEQEWARVQAELLAMRDSAA